MEAYRADDPVLYVIMGPVFLGCVLLVYLLISIRLEVLAARRTQQREKEKTSCPPQSVPPGSSSAMGPPP